MANETSLAPVTSSELPDTFTDPVLALFRTATLGWRTVFTWNSPAPQLGEYETSMAVALPAGKLVRPASMETAADVDTESMPGASTQ
jgi:hypothetical protein